MDDDLLPKIEDPLTDAELRSWEATAPGGSVQIGARTLRRMLHMLRSALEKAKALEDALAPQQRAVALLRADLDTALAACRAAARYDESIAGRAVRGEVQLINYGGAAEGDDLDELYADWINKAKAALAGRN